MQGAVGFLISFNCKFTMESSSVFFLNRVRFDRIVVMSLWPRFLGPLFIFVYVCVCVCDKLMMQC